MFGFLGKKGESSDWKKKFSLAHFQSNLDRNNGKKGKERRPTWKPFPSLLRYGWRASRVEGEWKRRRPWSKNCFSLLSWGSNGLLIFQKKKNAIMRRASKICEIEWCLIKRCNSGFSKHPRSFVLLFLFFFSIKCIPGSGSNLGPEKHFISATQESLPLRQKCFAKMRHTRDVTGLEHTCIMT